VREEVRLIAVDAADREEMRAIREQMAGCGPRLSTDIVRGEVFRLAASTRERRGARYAIVVQADDLLGPERGARRADICHKTGDVSADDRAVRHANPRARRADHRRRSQRLGDSSGRLDAAEIDAVEEALRLLLAL
jgi:mRNA-degrading endonuclease toxin of MazEF toxin-antitoxin module